MEMKFSKNANANGHHWNANIGDTECYITLTENDNISFFMRDRTNTFSKNYNNILECELYLGLQGISIDKKSDKGLLLLIEHTKEMRHLETAVFTITKKHRLSEYYSKIFHSQKNNQEFFIFINHDEINSPARFTFEVKEGFFATNISLNTFRDVKEFVLTYFEKVEINNDFNDFLLQEKKSKYYN